ncbi:armadillo repeat domain-containing protein [Chloropicon primus]|uniref:Armadillo repeat domain-containing protein n=1 Tax=Chloropicon primus TaxID=1764295 RepID=A0A5B8MCZ8_9CHLO|nr:armadillo repeat domain-containing protein [Chloropicon primus]UPQ97474.1 armadillo repeat domain-containing protein [Chloropicon primus]|mmetsp:Transcript_8774/g.25019  ORF Transcript_8774/g.25019 Transcript_8774/m.25019 type:complete len:1001 (+) Transcript_8774:500-3502(+)|eukprot:QDZ18263.1 armadillo repeat domain-containing protein [Chloropicon primus]
MAAPGASGRVQGENYGFPSNDEVMKVLVGLLSSTVDPFANHAHVYNQIQQLRDHLKGDFELYLVALMAQWNNAELRVEVCQAAGLLLKQSIKTKYKEGIAEKAKNLIKVGCLQMFLQVGAASSPEKHHHYKNKSVQNTLGTVMSTIVGFEGLSKWPELFERILIQLRTDISAASGDERGLLLEQLEETLDFLFKVLEEHGENSAICQEVAELCKRFDLGNLILHKAALPKTNVRVKTLKCVYHILQILYLSHSIDTNKEVLRQQQLTQNTLNQLLALTSNSEPEVKAVVCTGFVQILEVEAQLLQIHLENLVKYMLVMTQDQDTLVALEATGFWSVYMETIDFYSADQYGETSASLAGGESLSSDCEYWLQRAMGELIKVLTKNMRYSNDDEDVIEAEQIWEDIKTKAQRQQTHAFQSTDVRPFQLKNARGILGGSQEEEDSDVVESWTLRKSSAGTLDHLALHHGDALLPFLLPIVTGHLQHEEWAVRESAILALGAVIIGCPGLEEHTMDVMKVILPQLQQHPDSQHPMLVTICCWTLSRFARAVVSIADESGEAGRDLYEQMHRSLLLQLRSLHPKVVEAALSALAVCVQEITLSLLLQVLDPTIEEIRSMLGKRQSMSEKNVILVFDLVATLCLSVRESDAPELFSDQRYFALILGPLLDIFFSYQREKFGDMVFLNLVQTITLCLSAFGDALEAHCKGIVEFCVQVCQVASSLNDASDKTIYTISATLGLMAGLVHFPSATQLLSGQHQEFLAFLCSCLHHSSSDVKQAAFSLCGSLLSQGTGLLTAQNTNDLSMSVIQAGLQSLQSAIAEINRRNDLDGSVAGAITAGTALDEVNNAMWCLCKVAKSIDGQAVVSLLGLVTPFLERSSGFPRILLENASILIGCVASVQSQALAPYMDHFFWSWAVALGTLCDSKEKEDAFVGLFHMLQARQDMGAKYFPQVSNAIASWHQIKNPTLHQMLLSLLSHYKALVDWSRVPPATRNKLNAVYQLNLT